APSGAGKTTLCRRLLAEFPSFEYSVSCTTRPPREGETDGRDYHFITPEEFRQRASQGLFLEHAVVHGHLYGTLISAVGDVLKRGRDVLMDIDVQGAEQVRRSLRALPPDDAMAQAFLDVFISAPSLEELRRRLETRGSDAPDVIERRLRQAAAETARADEFMFQVVNDRLERAYDEIRAIAVAAGLRRRGWLRS
ncbi:MAG: guanylate kinase, partial [Kiritimatiellae bacterium]|nr:guanylate kinase [Kiritimatiellia bacterium]